MSDAAEEPTRRQLRHGLRIATTLVAVAMVCGLGLTNIVRQLDAHEAPIAQFAAFAALVAVLAGEVALLLRGRTWGRLRGPAIAVVLGASALSYVTLPEGRTSTTVDWIFGAANWVGVVVLLDRPLRASAWFLLAHELAALLNLLLLEQPDRAALARFATGSVTVVGFPLCAAVVATVMRGLSAAAADSRARLERVRVAEAVATESHRRRQQRFGALSATTIPMLEGLADGTLSPEDPEVQRRSAIEAARMRRLFAEVDTVTNPLLHELRHCIDVADRKGIVVELDTRGQWPTPPVAVRRDLTEAVLTVLATAASQARVTVVGQADTVTVDAVADCGEVNLPRPAEPSVQVESLTMDDRVWMEARWQPARKATT